MRDTYALATNIVYSPGQVPVAARLDGWQTCKGKSGSIPQHPDSKAKPGVNLWPSLESYSSGRLEHPKASLRSRHDATRIGFKHLAPRSSDDACPKNSFATPSTALDLCAASPIFAQF